MKRFTILFFGLLLSWVSQSQTDGISYQAVILNPDAQQIPGPDLEGGVLSEAAVDLRFTILNEDGSVVYQEIVETTTDIYGMVNVFIGSGAASSISNFDEINWDGTPRNLAVEIDLKIDRGFVFMSLEKLSFTPQAFHRNIIATGDMVVEGTVTFNSDFIIEGQTVINSGLDVAGDLTVGGDADIDEDLNVGEDIVIGDDLTVNGITDLNSTLNVNNGRTTNLSGRLEVEGRTLVNNGMEVAEGVTIGGSTVIGGNQTLGGNSNIGGRQDIVGSQTVGGNQTVTGVNVIGGNQTVGGTQNVGVDQIVAGNQSIGGNQSVGGDVVINGTTNMNGDLDLSGMLNVGSSGTLVGDLTVGGDGDFLGRMNIASTTTIGGTTDIFGSTFIDAFLTVSNNTTLNANLDVGGRATIGQSLRVDGLSSLNGSLKVNNAQGTFLTGLLDVEGAANFNSGLRVNSASPSILSGTLRVIRETSLEDDVTVEGGLRVSNVGTVEGNHIALFENNGFFGGDGLAVRIDTPTLTQENNFMTFFGQGNYVAGRIESFSGPDPVLNQGVVYGSKGADYAEWIEKENPAASYMPGEVVGIKGGKISLNTTQADHVLTISMAPIVLGNMPNEDQKENFEKVGFMGQVPAKVKGKVNVGDYIVASGNHDGFAIAISAEDIVLSDLKNVIGKAWTSSKGGESLINVSVGLKSNEWVSILETQENRLQLLEAKLQKMETLSEKIEKLETKLNAMDMN